MTAFPVSGDPRFRVETITDGRTTRIVIHGEADIATVGQLDATLSGLQLDGATAVRIDATDLTFFDVATLRCLTAFAHAVKQSGRGITMCGAAPLLRDVARALEVHEELGLD